jgi:two-component system KDP operon response regulator KdpE
MSADGPVVLVVEDEPAVRLFIRASLASHRFQLIETAAASEALALARSHDPALILLDLGLPDAVGVDAVRRMREATRAPILVISARGQEGDRVAALDAGADDYVTKPFGVNELLARMRVALRHATPASDGSAGTVLAFGALRIDEGRREVSSAGRTIHLTPTEYELLAVLAHNAGRVLTYRQILRRVWGSQDASQAHRVRVCVAELRKKVEDDPARPRHIMTEQGVGYRFREAAARE